MYNRKIKLIRALLGHERMSSAELMDKLDISQRTLRNEVKEINEILRQGMLEFIRLILEGII